MAGPVEDEREKMQRRDAVQCVDLGTARREHISTVDAASRYRHVTLEQIEAVREANKKGSAINRLAEANKSKLNAWNNAWKAVEGDVQLEDLDSMMNGQSHRAHLMDSIKQTGGQAYGKGAASHTVTRVSKSLTGSGAAGRGAIGKPKRRGSSVLQSQPSRQSLDPAKDCNNRDTGTAGPSKKNKGASAPATHRPQRPPTMKTRRAIALPTGVSYESMLVDSRAFMNAVSNAFPSKSSQRSTAKSEPPPSNKSDSDKPPKISPEAPVAREQKQVSTPVAPEPTPVVHHATPPKSNPKIEVFSTPSTDGGTSAGQDMKKPRIGFNSSLPQPLALWTAPAPAKVTDSRSNGPSLLDEGSAPTFSSAECLTAPKEPTPAVKKSSASTSTTTTDQNNAQNNASDLNAELEKLTKLLANISLLPDDAVSYLKDRKEELEGKLSKVPAVVKTEEGRAPIQAPTSAPVIKEEKKVFDSIPSHAARPSTTQGRSPPQLPTTSVPPSKDAKEPKEAKKPKENKENNEASLSDARRAAKPEYQDGTSSQLPAVLSSAKETKNDAKGNLFNPQHIAKFGKYDARAHSPRTRSDSNKGKEKVEHKSYTDRRSSRGNRHSPKSLFFPKADDPFGPTTGAGESNDEADNIIGEYLLPGRGKTRRSQPTPGKENNAEKSTSSKLEKKPASNLQVSPTATSKSNPAPNFPISAATMQYYKGPLHPEMAPEPSFTGKASVPGSTSNSGTNVKPHLPTAKERQPAPQPKPAVSFELPSERKNGMPENVPVSAATLQYFKGPVNTPTTSSVSPTQRAKPETKSSGAHIGSTKQGPSSGPPSMPSRSDVPNFPINATTMQYARQYFENNPNATQMPSKDDGHPSTPSTRNGSSGHQRPMAQPKRRTVFSPDASPFDPNASKKENSTPAAPETRSSGSSLFQERMEKKGVSVNRGNGLNASKYAF